MMIFMVHSDVSQVKKITVETSIVTVCRISSHHRTGKCGTLTLPALVLLTRAAIPLRDSSR